jgi:low temperature requirement protein LtrA
MVCGAIVVAVAIEEIIAHPTDPSHLPAIMIAVAGPLIFLIGNMLFRRTLGRRIPFTYLAPFVVLPLIGWGVHAIHASGIVLGLGMLFVLLPTALLNPNRAAS